MLSFVSACFSAQSQPRFAFPQFEPGSDKNKLELGNEILLSEIKLNHVNIKATRVYMLVKKINI